MKTVAMTYGPLAMIAEFELWLTTQERSGLTVSKTQIDAYIAGQEHSLLVCILVQYVELRTIVMQQHLARSN